MKFTHWKPHRTGKYLNLYDCQRIIDTVAQLSSQKEYKQKFNLPKENHSQIKKLLLEVAIPLFAIFELIRQQYETFYKLAS